MTLPHERYRALIQTEQFLKALLNPKQTPKVPKAIRQQAARCLKHYPWNLYLEQLAEARPDLIKNVQEKR